MARQRQPVKGARQRQPLTVPGAPDFGTDARGRAHFLDPILGTAVDKTPGVSLAGERRKNAESIRRQNLMRAAGFNVVADGIWGPRSQTAWSMYLQRRRNPVFTIAQGQGPVRLPTSRDRQPIQSFTGPTPEEIAAQKQLREEAARKQAIQQVVQQRKVILTRATALRQDPRQAAKLTLHQLTDVLVDKETGFTPDKPQAARSIQVWLRAHGQNVKVSGQYDRATHDALSRSFRLAQRAEVRKRVGAIRNELYATARAVPGTKPAWWPDADPIPTPEKLDAILQAGGMRAAAMLTALEKQAYTGAAGFDAFRTAKLLDAARKFQPFNLQLDPLLLSTLDPEQQAFAAYGVLASQTDLAPMPDLSHLTPAERQAEMQKRAGNKDVQEENAKRLGALRAQASVLFKATDPEDFKAKMLAYTAVEEEKFTRFQKDLASKHTPWWGKAVQKVIAPGEFLRTALVYDAMRGSQLGSDVFDFVSGRDHGDERVVEWEDAAKVLGRLPDGTPDDGLFTKASLGLRLGFELTADPLNYVRPFRLASSALRYGTRGSRLGRFVLVGGDTTKSVWGKALVYEKGTWQEGLGKATAIAAATHLGLDPTYAESVVAKATTLRDAALAHAREQVSLMARHGFVQPVSKSYAGLKVHVPKSAQTRRLIAESRAELTRWIEQGDELGPMVDAIAADVGSLYSHDNRAIESQIGASFKANIAVKARASAIHQTATSYAWDVYDNALESGVDAAAASAKALAEYDRVVSGAGVYIVGAGTPDKTILQSVDRRVAERLDAIDNTFMPVIQDILERRSVESGVPLYDDAGRWAERHGAAAETLRTRAAESFDDARKTAVPNPRHGIGHSWGEASEAMQMEVRVGTGRLQWYAARHAAAGTLPEGFDVDAASEKLLQEVMSHWDERAGLWYDARPTLEVSDLYLGAQSYLKMARGDFSAQLLGGVESLALPQHMLRGDAIDDGLWKFLWQAGGRYRKRVPFDNFRGRRFDGVENVGQGGDALAQEISAQDARAQALADALTKSQVGLSRAFDEALPGKLMEQHAVWLALAHSENLVAKAAYNVLKGALNTWVFATLPLRPGWMVRNVIDNTAKVIVAGGRDPKLFFLATAGVPYTLIRSVFDVGLTVLGQAIKFLDALFGTNAYAGWQAILQHSFWSHTSDVLGSIFRAHGIEVPQAVLDGARLDPYERAIRSAARPRYSEDEAVRLGLEMSPSGVKTAMGAIGDKYKSFRDGAFELMGNRPENYYKRILYQAEYRAAEKRVVADGLEGTEAALRAHDEAWKKVEDTLFDYSKITVIEDNFRVFFPFIQFWRKNSGFWAKSFTSKPWLTNAVLQVDKQRQESHQDLPLWMRRYLHVDEVADAAAVIPGLDKVVEAMLPADVMYDPMNLMSFAPFYRSYLDIVGRDKENPNLPSDRDGWKIIAPMIDAISDYGLGMNPIVRKPLENIGIANLRSWQTVFPQTSLAVAISREFVGERANKIADWERIFTLMQGEKPSDAIADNFDFYVQAEVANQAERGEPLDMAKARETVKDWFLLQNVWGYFTGVYLRRATPEDIHLSKLQDGVVTGALDYRKLGPKDKRAYDLWRMRGYDRLTWERYVTLLPLIESYYRTADFETKQAMKAAHPEISRWVDSTWKGRLVSGKSLVNMQQQIDSDTFFRALEVTNDVDPAYDVRQAALSVLKTPELDKYWQANDTPAQIRDRMVRAAAFEYYHDLNQRYFDIPATDFEARSGYLDAHPELVRHWNVNNSRADDFKATLSAGNAHLREMYFNVVKDHGGGNAGFDAAAPLLKRYPFMFEDTKSADKVDQTTGTWKIGGSGKFSPQRQHDYLQAKDSLSWFFKTLMPKVGEKRAFDWLEKSDTPQGKLVRDYLRKWGKHSEKQLAYLKAAKWLRLYFDMPKDQASAWLAAGSEGAKIVQAFFDKYATPHFESVQQARDWRERKPWLKYYFGLGKAERKKWLYSSDPHAQLVLDYFKKYGKTHQAERAFIKGHPEMSGGTPEQRRRLEFWKQYYSLEPDQRIAFVEDHAEDHGVFIYGIFGEEEAHDREAEYTRRAVGLGVSKQQAEYLYVKPLLDYYNTLPKDDRDLFVRANPELQHYFDGLHTSITGNAKLDKVVEAYFDLPEDSQSRSFFLRQHPEVQVYFDSKASPAERAMRNLLNQYFDLRSSDEKKLMLRNHPEIQVYFDQRKLERQQTSAQLGAFDQSDPRLAGFYHDAASMDAAAERMRKILRLGALRRLAPDTIEGRRERRPLQA